MIGVPVTELVGAAVLETERLRLRDPREADFPALLAFNDSPRAGFVGGAASRQQIWRGLLANIGHWALRGYGFWSVDRKDGAFVGRVGVIYHDGWPEPELAWHLFDGFEGQGFAQEAALAAQRDYAARISSQPLISMIDVANPRSEALALRLGAVRQSTEVDEKGSYYIYRHIQCPAGGAQ